MRLSKAQSTIVECRDVELLTCNVHNDNRFKIFLGFFFKQY